MSAYMANYTIQRGLVLWLARQSDTANHTKYSTTHMQVHLPSCLLSSLQFPSSLAKQPTKSFFFSMTEPLGLKMLWCGKTHCLKIGSVDGTCSWPGPYGHGSWSGSQYIGGYDANIMYSYTFLNHVEYWFQQQRLCGDCCCKQVNTDFYRVPLKLQRVYAICHLCTFSCKEKVTTVQ